jgi:glycosyltransferase involved in cell wall biosynthesis
MASRLPVVATRAGGIPEVVEDRETGLLVPPRDPAALARAILELYRDRELGGRLAGRGLEVVHRKYSAEAMAGKIAGLYEQFAAKKGIRL